jgi:hypothetical protein
MSLTIEDVRAQVARVSHKVDGIEFRWNVSYAFEAIQEGDLQTLVAAPIGFFVQIEYDEADIDDLSDSGALEVQQGRKWFVGAHVSESEVIQTMLKAALASAEHRTREWFLVDGKRIYGPHMSSHELSALLGAKEDPYGGACVDYGDGRSLWIHYNDPSKPEPELPS